jgi:hypothetical protein
MFIVEAKQETRVKQMALLPSEMSVDFQRTTRRLSQKIELFIITAVRISIQYRIFVGNICR